MLRFANEEYLYLLLIIPMCVLWFLYCRYRRRRNLSRFGNLEMVNALMPSVSTGRPSIQVRCSCTCLSVCHHCDSKTADWIET